MKLFLMVGGLCLAINLIKAAEEMPSTEMYQAYSDMQYSQARQLAYKYSKLSEARLIKALCAVFDRKKQDLQYGLPELKNIYDDRSLNPKLRLQAGLAYARAAQTLQMRKDVYSIADGIDYNAIYDSIINTYPDTPEACFAAVYQAQCFFDSNDSEQKKQGVKFLEKFLNTYKGPRKYLSGINILVADQYVIISENYGKAVLFLKAAFDEGISNPRTKEIVLFRIARSYDLKLKDGKNAIKYYKMFLQKFPNSSSAPVAKRHLRNLEGKRE